MEVGQVSLSHSLAVVSNEKLKNSPCTMHRWFAAFDPIGNGQPHFFPGIINAKEWKKQLELRGVKSKPRPKLFKSKKN